MCLAAAPVAAYVGFVTVAERQEVSVTIYNSQDVTLVRDRRNVVLKKGSNALRFEWAGTLIDPTSLVLFPPQGVSVLDTTYPLDQGESLVWNLKAARQVGGALAVQYFTSGLTWAADHLVTLTAAGKANVQTWITVRNNSGEDYTNTRFRLVVGEVRLVERIRDIAQRFRQEAQNYDMKEAARNMLSDMAAEEDEAMPMSPPMPSAGARPRKRAGPSRPKSVARESLSELHLYSIEGTEDVANSSARRMRAFAYDAVGVQDVYRCVDPSGLVHAQRVLTFKNTKRNRMGTQPLPEGRILLWRSVSSGLAFDAAGNLPYTPMGEEAEAPLGITRGVTCEHHIKNFRRANLKTDALGRIVGWEDVTHHQMQLVNGADQPIDFEVRQHQQTPFSFSGIRQGSKEDVSTLLIKSAVPAFSHKDFTWEVAVQRGTLATRKGN